MQNNIYIVIDKNYIAGPVTEEKPDISIYPIDKEGYAKYEKDVEAYKAHLASLPRIKRADNGEWKEGQELERDKDFTTKRQWYREKSDEWNDLDEDRAVNVFTKIRTVAIPISQPQPLQSAEEEDLIKQMWDEAFGKVWMQSTWTGELAFIQAKELGFRAFKMLNHSPKTDIK